VVVVVPVTMPPTPPPVPVPVMMMVVVVVMPMTRRNFVIVSVRWSVLSLFTGRLCSLCFRLQCVAVSRGEQRSGLRRSRCDCTRSGGEPKRQLEKLASFHQTTS
jgi:hypothetical protein